MRIGNVIIMAGIIMTVAGFAMFTSMQEQSSSDAMAGIIRHGGAFMGLLGIGAGIAGVLLYIISRQHTSI